MRGERTRRVVTAATAVSGQLDYSRGRVRRYSWRETSGTTGAIFELYDGSGAGGILVDTIALSAGQSTRDYFLSDEYEYYGGLYLLVVSGTFKGVVVVEPWHQDEDSGMPVIVVGSVTVNVEEQGPR